MNRLESALSPLVKIGLKSVLIFGVPTKAVKVSDISDIFGNQKRVTAVLVCITRLNPFMEVPEHVCTTQKPLQ